MDPVIQLRQQIKEEFSTFSQFRLYTVGIVAENKPRTTSQLLVVPIEILPLLNGALGVEDEVIEDRGKDFYDREYTVNVKARQAIECKWLPWGSNRATAPDMRAGERVFIYRFADADEYYWVDSGLDAQLRRLETVTWLFNADPDGTSDEPRNGENSYLVEISTHDKLITLKTTSLNGEPFEYTFQFNTGEGRVTLADNDGNYIEFNSDQTSITFENREGTRVSLDKQNLFAYAPNDIFVEALENIFLKCKNYTQTVEENYTSNVGDAIAITSATYKLQTGSSLVETNNFTVDSPTSTFTGQVAVGSISVAPGSKGGNGGMSITGNMDVGGNVQVDGTIVCRKLTSIEPISAPNV